MTDFRFLGRYYKKDTLDVLKDHKTAIFELLGPNGTLVVPTASLSLCNTDIPFDIDNTPSETGVFTEYIRKSDNSLRSFHPFISYTALGKDAVYFTKNVSRHAFGPETPMDRMINRDALVVSIGQPPARTPTTVHHIEMIMGVPYRYVKEFMHPVCRNDKIVVEPFYRHVWYYKCEVEPDWNIKIFNSFSKASEIKEARLGRGRIFSYSMKQFFDHTIKLFRDDIYIWTKEIPHNKPYRETM